jgi:Na+-driven multidrug efflux pump
MIVSMCRTIIVYAPLALLFASFWDLPGVFMAAFTANILAGILGFTWFRSAFRSYLETDDTDEKDNSDPTPESA